VPGFGAGLPTIAKRRVARIDPIGEYAPDAAALTPGTCSNFSTTLSMKRTRVGGSMYRFIGRPTWNVITFSDRNPGSIASSRAAL
jgi:hypothetical protein